jgi:hypothetical protein
MYRKEGEPPIRGTSKIANGEPAHDDGQAGGWSRKQLLRMDEEFRERVERALRLRDETPKGAGGVASRRAKSG